eukprot:GFYU01000716.1.p1 GENE.GFYU01000716.1~~GFYU01000716.1.p1  ORF type:complete len:522 (-),score=171.76 GFYU01000716.1:157-1722(-)
MMTLDPAQSGPGVYGPTPATVSTQSLPLSHTETQATVLSDFESSTAESVSAHSHTNTDATPTANTDATPTANGDARSHLIVCSHGLWGFPEHMLQVVSALEDKYGDEVVILNSGVNAKLNSYDGVCIGGDRLFDDIERVVEEHKSTLKKISLVGYSLGGLYIRYAIGHLYEVDFFGLQPMNYISMATPHLGRVNAAPHVELFLRFLGSDTGRQLALHDESRLLHEMTRPTTTYMRGLQQFAKRFNFANTVNDRAVPYDSCSMTGENPYQGKTHLPRTNERYIAVHSVHDEHDEHKITLTHEPQPSDEARPHWTVNPRVMVPAMVVLSPVLTVGLGMIVSTLVSIGVYKNVEKLVSNTPRRRSSASQRRITMTEAATNAVDGNAEEQLKAVPTTVEGENADDTAATGATVNVGVEQQPAHTHTNTHIHTPALDEVTASVSVEDVSVEEVAAEEVAAPTQACVEGNRDQMLQEMIENLATLKWCRVNTALPGPNSHGRIIHRRKWVNDSGKSVLTFLTDHLVR